MKLVRCGALGQAKPGRLDAVGRVRERTLPNPGA